jgi:hypothetical protein
VLISYPYTSNPLSLTYLATGSPNCPSPITRILPVFISRNEGLDLQECSSSQSVTANGNPRVSSKICATKPLDLCL